MLKGTEASNGTKMLLSLLSSHRRHYQHNHYHINRQRLENVEFLLVSGGPLLMGGGPLQNFNLVRPPLQFFHDNPFKYA